MRILIADPIAKEGIRRLRTAGFDVVQQKTATTPEELGDCAGLIVRSRTKVDEALLERAPQLKIVARAGIGYDNIDLKAATERDILVVNAPGGNANAVAEHTIGLMLALVRKIPAADAAFKQGLWIKNKLEGGELSGKTIGIIGYGKIGRLVAQKALGLGMHVLAYDKFVTPKDERVVAMDFETLLKRSDFVSIHVPPGKDTHHLIAKAALAQMKRTAYLINTARGGIVDEDALYETLVRGRLAGAACDVFEKEPPSLPLKPLYLLDNFIATPHVAGQTKEAERNIGLVIADTVISYLRDDIISNAVNARYIDAERYKALEPYRRLAEALVAFLIQYAGACESFVLELWGDFLEGECEVLEGVVLRDVLRLRLPDAPVGYVSAREIAEEAGFLWEMRRHAAKQQRIGISFTGPASSIFALGKTEGEGLPLLTTVDSFALRGAPLSGELLVFINDNVPGVYGKVTKILGEHHCNVAEMHGGPNTKGDLAFTVVNLDRGEITEQVLTAIRAIPEIRLAQRIML